MTIQATGSRPVTARQETAEANAPEATQATPAAGTPEAAAPTAGTTATQEASAYTGTSAEAERRDAAVGNTPATAAAPESRESIARRMDFLSEDQKRQTLKEAGVAQEWTDAASPEQRREALVDVEQARQRGGQADLTLPTVKVYNPGINNDSEYVAPTETDIAGKASFHADAQGRVGASADAPHSDLTATRALTAQAEADAKPWPGGKPEERIQTRFTPGGDPNSVTGTASRQDKIDTVVAAMPAESREETRAVMEGRQPAATEGVKNLGITDESLDAAFNTVLEARNTPGSKDLKLDITTARTVETWGGGDSGNTVMREEAQKTLAGRMDVSADGKVNGEPLPVDTRARLASEVKTVPDEFKDQTLREAGLSEDWMATASPLQKDNALARLREASMKPGSHELDLGFAHTTEMGGDSGGTYTRDVPGKVRLDVAADGKVNGKTPTIEKALATQLQMESLPMAEKRALMGSLGFDAEAQRNVRPDQAASLLTRAAMTSTTPGDHRLEVGVGNDKYALQLKVGADGKLEGAGTAKIPPPKKKSFFQRILQPILTIASIIPSPIQPFAAIANGVIGGVQAVKNGNILGAVASFAGAGGALAGLAGNAGLAGTLGSVSAVAGSANGIITAAKTGDVAGLFSAVVSGASAVGTLAGTPISSDLARLGTVVSTANAVVRGDLAGALGGVVSLAQGNRTAEPEREGGVETTPTGAAADGTGAETFPVRGPGDITATDLPPLEGGADPAATGDVDNGGGGVTATPSTDAPAGPARPESRTVNRGDSLSRIAQDTLGDANRWPEIYEYNKELLGNDPNRLRAGMELRIPPEGYAVDAARTNQLHNQAHIAPPAAPTFTDVDAQGNAVQVAADGTMPVSASVPTAGSGAVTGTTPAAGSGSNGGVAAAKWIADALGVQAGAIEALARTNPGALGTLASVVAAGANVLDASTKGDLSLAGRVATAAGAIGTDLVLSVKGNPVLALTDSAIKVLDPVAAHALGWTGDNGTLKLSEMFSPGTQVGGVANNVAAIYDAVFGGNQGALDYARNENITGRNGLFMQTAARFGEAVAPTLVDWVFAVQNAFTQPPPNQPGNRP